MLPSSCISPARSLSCSLMALLACAVLGTAAAEETEIPNAPPAAPPTHVEGSGDGVLVDGQSHPEPLPLAPEPDSNGDRGDHNSEDAERAANAATHAAEQAANGVLRDASPAVVGAAMPSAVR